MGAVAIVDCGVLSPLGVDPTHMAEPDAAEQTANHPLFLTPDEVAQRAG